MAHQVSPGAVEFCAIFRQPNVTAPVFFLDNRLQRSGLLKSTREDEEAVGVPRGFGIPFPDGIRHFAPRPR